MGKTQISNYWCQANQASSGGIRGIVELEVLEAIERKFSRSQSLPIQAFFDLIVGTR